MVLKEQTIGPLWPWHGFTFWKPVFRGQKLQGQHSSALGPTLRVVPISNLPPFLCKEHHKKVMVLGKLNCSSLPPITVLRLAKPVFLLAESSKYLGVTLKWQRWATQYATWIQRQKSGATSRSNKGKTRGRGTCTRPAATKQHDTCDRGPENVSLTPAKTDVETRTTWPCP